MDVTTRKNMYEIYFKNLDFKINVKTIFHSYSNTTTAILLNKP